MTLYETLGVPPDASAADLKRAYRDLCKEHHPDKGGDKKRFQAIARAYQVLSDPETREHYDLTGDADAATGWTQIADKAFADLILLLLGNETNDIRGAAIEAIEQDTGRNNATLEKLRRQLEKTEQQASRVKCLVEDDPLAAAIEAKRHKIQADISRGETAMKVCEAIRKRLDDYEFETRERNTPPAQPIRSWMDDASQKHHFQNFYKD
jgi:DnaJ-class molecular chaperone